MSSIAYVLFVFCLIFGTFLLFFFRSSSRSIPLFLSCPSPSPSPPLLPAFFNVASFHKEGYAILPEVLSAKEIDQFSEMVTQYRRSPHRLSVTKWRGLEETRWAIADFKEDDLLRIMFQRLNEHSDVQLILRHLLGQDYQITTNDIGMDMPIPWHTDRLNGVYRCFEDHGAWQEIANCSFKIIKVLMYLQDHSGNADRNALTLVPGSHTDPTSLERTKKDPTKAVVLHPRKGDLIIFDQRITHRGASKETISLRPSGYKHRYLVTVGYGANNIFTWDFTNGSRIRQSEHNSAECGYNAYGTCSIKKICNLFPRERQLANEQCPKPVQ